MEKLGGMFILIGVLILTGTVWLPRCSTTNRSIDRPARPRCPEIEIRHTTDTFVYSVAKVECKRRGHNCVVSMTRDSEFNYKVICGTR